MICACIQRAQISQVIKPIQADNHKNRQRNSINDMNYKIVGVRLQERTGRCAFILRVTLWICYNHNDCLIFCERNRFMKRPVAQYERKH